MNNGGLFTAFIANTSGMTSLCPSCTSSSYANALNSSGIAVGSFVSSSGYLHAAEYSNGSVVDLGTLAAARKALRTA